jgi:hypothetical protein
VNGLSSKQLKRVEALAPKFRIINEEQELELEILQGGSYLKYPRPTSRQDIIKKFHLLGHFKYETTLNRVKEKYYWRAMAEDVKRIVERCEICHQQALVPAVHHPAKALEILGLGDRVAIDLSFGYEKSEEGFIGLFVAVEYLINYVYLEGIKSKSMEEIATCLLRYIGLFGPPKIILSDNGPEFCNKLVSSLLSLVGVEHVVTSPYRSFNVILRDNVSQNFHFLGKKFTF